MSCTDEHTETIARVVALLRKARYAVALTGAGVSTPSGIPDFRSPGTGLWEHADPMKVASIYAFRHNPEAFYTWIRPLVKTFLDAKPNPAHKALADLEAGGWLKAIITQNIDNLHQKAGAREVLELHGHLREATCINCYHVVPAEELLNDLLSSDEVPRCAACGGVLKPNIVLFGEQLPIQVVNRTMQHIRRADLMIVVGSSLEIIPASQLPRTVHEHSGRLVVVNLTPTYIDNAAEVVIHTNVAEVLPHIAQGCARR
jgi:NAD-dependent deacetylase